MKNEVFESEELFTKYYKKYFYFLKILFFLYIYSLCIVEVNESSYSSLTRKMFEFDSKLIESNSNIIILDSSCSRA